MNSEKQYITDKTPIRKLLETYKGAYRILICNGVSLSPSQLSYDDRLEQFLSPENKDQIIQALNQLVAKDQKDLEKSAQLKDMLVKPGKVNMAGFADFTWHEAFISEMENYARLNDIPLHHQFFLKNDKKAFQFYLAQCEKASDLPDILVGKGFSSLMTRKFVDQFIHTGEFDMPIGAEVNELWEKTGLYDSHEQYHAFGAEEQVILVDLSNPNHTAEPARWTDLLQPEYKNTVTQMGKPQRDHFGANQLFYLHEQGGDESIRAYANAVQHKWHFSKIIKDVGKNHPDASPYSIVQRYTTLFVRSDAKVKILSPEDGNPVSAFFILVKKGSSEQVLQIARHFFSEAITRLLENAGAISAGIHSASAPIANIRWIGWDAIKNSNLPYQKDDFSEVAFNVFENK
ncbi:MAG: hypothetical protein RIS29_2329 [Bacteroidota bacterium]|jgi:hypothetical protein